jgi:dolichol-phosphate mannosyltransferase
MKEICVVAPIYNEEQIIEEFVKQVSKQLELITGDYQIILIDDGSKDKSWQLISLICQSNKKVVGLKLSKNFGHHQAITAGLDNSNANWTIVMDSDLQDRPEVIPEMYRKAKQGFDVVFVNRVDRPESYFYKILQKTFYFMLRLLSGIKFNSSQANFSIISNDVVNAFRNFPEQARFYGSTILWLGFKRGQISSRHGKRFKGKPSYSVKKRIKLAADVILAFSDRPLKFAIYLGLFMVLILLAVIFYISFLLYFKSIEFTNNIIILLLFFIQSTFQILILGILGIYISRIFAEVKRRPIYILEEKINYKEVLN